MPPTPRYRLQNLSFTTKLVILCIFSLSLWGRDILSVAISIIGHDWIRLLVKLGIILAGIYALSGFSLTKEKILATSALVMLGMLASALLGLPEERVHLILFATLGASLFRDLQPGPGALKYAILIGICVGALDELFQAALPWRVGDLRDVFINCLGVIWGSVAQRLAASKDIKNRR